MRKIIAAEVTSRLVFRRRDLVLAVALGLVAVSSHPALAASLTPKDIQLLGRALAMLQPSPSGVATLAVTYVHGDEASYRDAESIAALVGDGLHSGKAVFQPKLIDTASLGAGGYAVIVAAAGADGERVMTASRTARVLCVTADFTAVQAGRCIMAIRSDPRVDILINHTAATTAGIEFAPAFLMMIREI